MVSAWACLTGVDDDGGSREFDGEWRSIASTAVFARRGGWVRVRLPRSPPAWARSMPAAKGIEWRGILRPGGVAVSCPRGVPYVMNEFSRSDDKKPAPLSAALLALSVGIAVGAAAVSAYTFVRRAPDGLITDSLGRPTATLGASMIVTTLITIVLAVQDVRTLFGRRMIGAASATLMTVAALGAWVCFSDWPREQLSRISGPGASPVVALTRTSWLLLTLSAVLLLVGVLVARHRTVPTDRRLALPLSAAGTGVSLIAALGVGAAVPTTMLTASPIPTPHYPTDVGSTVGYSFALPGESAGWVLPAGPGFIVFRDGAYVAYDGRSGAERWRFSQTQLPAHCDTTDMQSTGTGPEAVVVLSCEISDYPNASIPYVVAIDAITGRYLGSTNVAGVLRGQALAEGRVVAVKRGNEIGALDPRSAALRWTRTLPCPNEHNGPYPLAIFTVTKGIGYLCAREATMHVLDADSGDDHPIGLNAIEHPASATSFTIVAITGNTTLIRASGTNSAADAVFVVNAGSGAVTRLPVSSTVVLPVGPIPGPAVQLSHPGSGNPQVYRFDQQRVISAVGVKVQNSRVPTDQQWALIGDRLVTAAATDGRNALLTSVATDGRVTSRPSPCGRDTAGIMPVPGAVLLLCHRGAEFTDEPPKSYEILGLPT